MAQNELRNDCEGIASGTAVTAGNSGGAAWRNAFDTALGTVTSDNTHGGAHGARAIKLSTVTAAGTGIGWAASQTVPSTAWLRGYFYITANPATTYRLMAIGNAASSSLRAALVLNTTGVLVGVDSVGTTLITTTASISLNAWTRIEFKVIGSATAGQIEVELFNSASVDSVTPTETKTSGAASNTGGTDLGSCVWGDTGGGLPASTTLWVDSPAFSANGYPGPFVPGIENSYRLSPVPVQSNGQNVGCGSVQRAITW